MREAGAWGLPGRSSGQEGEAVIVKDPLVWGLLRTVPRTCRVIQKKYATGKPDQKDLSENLAAAQGLAHMISECDRLFEVSEGLAPTSPQLPEPEAVLGTVAPGFVPGFTMTGMPAGALVFAAKKWEELPLSPTEAWQVKTLGFVSTVVLGTVVSPSAARAQASRPIMSFRILPRGFLGFSICV